MKKENIKITGIDIYHPSKKVDNDYFVEQMRKAGAENPEEGINFAKAVGRNVRYEIDIKEETMLDLGAKAAEKALQKAGLKATDIDALIIATDSPEYLYPSNAVIVADMIGASKANTVYDINNNCIGMLTAFDQVSRYMMTNKRMKKALVIGSVQSSVIMKKYDPLTYPVFADGACAIVLEKVEEEGGFIDSVSYTNTIQHDTFRFPNKGLANLFVNDFVTEEDKKLRYTPAPTEAFAGEWIGMIKEVLSDNGLEVENVDHFCFSQFAKGMGEEVLGLLNVPLEKSTYIGHIYGYTGTSSPFFALYSAIEEGKVKKGDRVILASVGAGYGMSVILYQL